jgi:hypothetical protein
MEKKTSLQSIVDLLEAHGHFVIKAEFEGNEHAEKYGLRFKETMLFRIAPGAEQEEANQKSL